MFTLQTLLKSWYLLTLVTLLACSNKSDDPSASTRASMQCQVENTSWQAFTFDNVVTKMSSQAYTGKRLDIKAVALDGSFILLTISDPSSGIEGEGIKPDTYYINALQNLSSESTSSTWAKAAAGVYTVINASTQKAYTGNPSSGEGQIQITQCDPAQKTISGTFSYQAENVSDNTHVNITSGTFTNLSYRVKEQ